MVAKHDPRMLEVVGIFGIVAIVLIVAVAMNDGFNFGESSITGNVIARQEIVNTEITNIKLVDVYTNPTSPIIGEPFKVYATVKNTGETTIKEPFYIKIMLQPETSHKPMITQRLVMPKILAPGDEATVNFQISLLTNEGTVKITGIADSTGKIVDNNPSDNERTKTIVITAN